MRLDNAVYSDDHFKQSHLFICAIDFEPRSYYLLDQVISSVGEQNVIALVIDGCQVDENMRNRLDYMHERNIKMIVVKQSDSQAVYNEILSAIRSKIQDHSGDPVTIDIDYSSMPREWSSI